MGRSSLYLIASGLLGYALLLIAQTLFALPSLRAGFLLMDGLLLAGLLANKETRLKAASAFASCAFFIDVIALVDRHGNLTVALSASEQVLGLGLAFAITSLLRSRGEGSTAVKVLAIVSYSLATIAVLLKLSRIFDSGARGLVAAWISWFVEVSRPLANAAIAFVIARSMATNAPKAVGDGPYRAPGAVDRAPVVEPVAPFVLDQLKVGENGLRLYSHAFTFRFLSATFMGAVFAAAVVFLRGADDVGGVFVLQPLLGAVSGAFVVFALVKSVRVFDAAHSSNTGAITFLALATIGDVLTLLVDVAAFAGSSSYRAARTASEILLLELPATGFLGAIALLLVVRAFKKVGRVLNEEAVVRRASLVQSLMMMATVGVCAIVWTLLTIGGHRRYSSSTSAGEMVLVLEGLVVFALVTAVGFVHLTLISLIRNAVKKRTTSS